MNLPEEPPVFMHTLFPPIEPYAIHQMVVSPIHTLYVEEVGNPQGIPVLFLHGGPGAGISPAHRQLFDPKTYRIILFDQRGAGQSTPHASLEDNTTWHLVADIEHIRSVLGIERWLVFGGSWGSTLGLAYAQTHPDAVSGLILRGIFLCRHSEIQWFYQYGAHHFFPEAWRHYLNAIPFEEHHDLLHAFHRRLTHPDPAVQLAAAKAWSIWEGATCHLIPNPQTIEAFGTDHTALSVARIECHYFVNHCFFRQDDQLIVDAHRIRHIPTWLVHGRYDVICPVENAIILKDQLPDAQLTIVPDAGHAFSEPGILNALIEATEAFKRMTLSIR